MAGVDAAWARGQTASYRLQGVPATVTRPAPDDTPYETRGIWTAPLEETQPIGRDLYRRQPRQVLSLLRDETLTSVPKEGTTILAPERQGETAKTWRVEGYEKATDVDEFRVIVIPVNP